MKKSKLKFLALPLCLSFCLAGCAESLPKQNKVEAVKGATTLFEGVEVQSITPKKMNSLTALYEGDVTAYKNVLLYKDVDKDAMNNVTETFELYDVLQGKTVLTLTNTYPDGAYGRNSDDYGKTLQAPSVMNVSFGGSAASYVAVEKIVNTRVADEILEEEESCNGYITTRSYDYYGLDGTFIATVQGRITPKSVVSNETREKILFGDTAAEIDIETGKVYKTWSVEKGSVNSCYDYENGKLGIYLYAPYMDNAAVEAYDKEGNLVSRYVYESGYNVRSFVLNNGNVVIQYINETDGAEYDALVYGSKVKVKTVLFDTFSGKAQKVDFGYYLHDLKNSAELAAENGNTYTDAVYNLAYAVALSPRTDVEWSEPTVLFMNSALEVSYVQADLVPEIENWDSIRKISKDKYLVTVNGGTDASYLVVNEKMEAICYLPSGAEPFANGFATTQGIYGYDFKELCAFDDAEYDNVYVLGENVVCEGLDAFGEAVIAVYEQISSGKYFKNQSLFDSAVFDVTDNYVVIYDEEDKEYALYDTGMNVCLRSANRIYVTEYDNGIYLVSTVVDWETVYYSWRVKPTSGGNE